MNLHDEDMKGRRLAHYMWDELEKISNVAMGSAPVDNAGSQQTGELQGGVQSESTPGVIPADEPTPAHGVVASRVEQLTNKKARGTPIIQPPPGFVFNPELQAFQPDPNNPGWMEANQAAEAAKAKAFYDKGQQDMQQAQAQQEVDQQVGQQADAAAQQQAQQQQQAAAQQQASMAQPQMQAQEDAKQQAKATMGGLQTPAGISGEQAAPKQEAGAKKAPAKRSPSGGSQKGVTIKIGK